MWLIAWAVLAFAVPVEGVPSPRDHGGWVTDMAGVIPPDGEARIDAAIDRLNTDVGVEIAVVTVDDVPGTPKAFATELFNHWGIGQAATDNGLLVLLVMGERRLEMETGDGMQEVLPDAWLADMQQRDMVPAFKRGDFGGGIEAGIVAVESQLRTGPGETLALHDAVPVRNAIAPAPAAPAAPAPIAPGSDGTALALAGGFAGGASMLGGAVALWSRRRRRFCPQCDVRMLVLDEVEDDAHLDPGQRKEESLRSVDWQVLICPRCQFSRTLRHARWFSGYRSCPSCKNKTMKRTSQTLVSATYDHGGEVQVTEDCKHCSHHRSWTRYTSQLTRSDSSSSSSSGSSGGSSGFGGGSSSGGGAGSSW